MKTQLLNLLLLFISTVASAQHYGTQEFKVSRDDFDFNTYAKDSTANALVLYEYGNSYIDDDDFLLKTEYQKKVRIFNRNGFDHATVEVPLYTSKGKEERIKDITAITYNLNSGALAATRLKDSEFFYEDVSSNVTVAKFSLPNVQEGSVIIYSYKLSSPYIFKYHGWTFQEDIPKIYSEYDTSIPGNYNYNIKLVGPYKLHTNESKIESQCLSGGNGAYADCAITKFVMKDIPAFIEEDYMTSKYNYLSRIDFELKTVKRFDGGIDQVTKTWDAVDHELKTEKEIGNQLRKSIKSEDILSASILNEKDPLKKAQAIYAYIQDNYKWNGDYKIFTEGSVKDLLKTKSGNVSSINILLHNLLNDVGIEAQPVLLSTRNNGFPTKLYPVLSDFNYLIVQTSIQNKTYMLDATEQHLPFGSLPFRCLNAYGRKIDFKTGSDWVDIKVDKPSVVNHRVEMEIKGDSAVADAFTIRSGYYAYNSKKDFLNDKTAYYKKKKEDFPNFNITKHEVVETDRNDATFKEELQAQISLEPMSKEIDGVTQKTLYINPILFHFFDSNPFQLQERNYPIDFGYKNNYSYTIKLNTKGYEVSELPKNINYGLPNGRGSLVFAVNQAADNIVIYLKFSLKETAYTPEYYESIKQLASKLVNIQNNSLIVLNSKVSI